MLNNTNFESAQENASRLSRVQSDLLLALKEFPRESTGIKILSEKMGVSARTLRRIIKGTHTPSYQTILKIYRYLYGTKNDRETILSMPQDIARYIKIEHDNFSFLDDEGVNFTEYIDDLIKNDSVFRSIYVETATGITHKSKIGFEHGQHGLKVIEKMLQLNVIKEIEPETYTASIERSCLTPNTLYEIGKYLLEYKYSQDKEGLRGENFFNVYFDGLNQDAYNEVISIQWEAMNKIKGILKDKNNKGIHKFWTITYTDTLVENLIYGNDNKEVIQ
tara:strand:- start:438 stop:1268 length:831 start_codon:yes stop_codon:yes gene_type:complete